MKNYGILYKIINTVNWKIYIGQTIQSLKNRKKDHRNCMVRLQHLPLYRAFRKYGFEKFEWTTIYSANDKNDLDKREKYYIQFYTEHTHTHTHTHITTAYTYRYYT